MPAAAPEFRFRHEIPVRFRDIDGVGHAHHGMTLIYFEEARWAYWRHVVGQRTVDQVDYVMGEAHVRWEARIEWPQTLSVGVRVASLGRKSFQMQYEIRGEDGEALATGRTTQVMYDYAARTTFPIPADLRQRLLDFDGPFSDGNPSAKDT